MIMQRRSLAVGSAPETVHRLIWWTSQFAQRQVFAGGCDDGLFLAHFAPFSRSSGCPRVERQFSEGFRCGGVAGSLTPR